MTAADLTVFVSIAAAVVAWALAEILRSPTFWAAGALLALIHSVAAFGQFYGWSHETARVMTARQTAEATGIDFDGGIYVNYALVAVWLLDACWWCGFPRSYAARPRPISWAVRGFIFFIMLNGSIVFADGWARLLGLAAVGSVIASFVWHSLRGTASQPAIKSQHT
jgi:hypothetical protein